MENSDKLTNEQLLIKNKELMSRITELEESLLKFNKIKQDLKESEEKYRALYENAPLSYQSLNEDGSFKDVNPTWLTTLGYERDEVIGKFYKDFLHPDWQVKFEKNFPEFKKQGYVHDIHFKIRHKSGKYLDIEFEGCIGYNTDGSFKQTYCVFKEITELKNAENMLAMEKQILANIIEGTNAGTWYWNIQTGEVIFNERWAEIIGYTLKELEPIGISTWNDNVHPDDLLIANELLDKHFKGELEIFNVIIRQPHKNGSWVWVDVRGKVIEWTEDGKPLLMSGVHIDITQNKLTEEALKESQEKFKTLITNSEGVVYIIDKDGTFLLSEGKGLSALGLKPGEVVGLSVYDLYKDSPKMLEEMRRVFKGETIESEVIIANEVYFKNWYTPQLSSEGEVIGLLGLSVNITESKKAEEELKKVVNLNRMILDTAGEGIYGLDIKGKTTFVNPSATKMTGWSIEELLGKEHHELVHHHKPDGSIYSKEDCPIHNTYKDGKVKNVVNEVFWRKDGSSFPVEYISSPIRDEHGELAGAVVTFQDITKRKQTEKELVKHREKLEEMVAERTRELEDKNKRLDDAMKVFVGREQKIAELERRIQALKGI